MCIGTLDFLFFFTFVVSSRLHSKGSKPDCEEESAAARGLHISSGFHDSNGLSSSNGCHIAFELYVPYLRVESVCTVERKGKGVWNRCVWSCCVVL